ncbi:TPA: baseplate tail-tube junction protein [Vibrio cholerae]|nr:baseplate tail tube cap [Providencia phage PSTRCR_127]QQV89050.1 baseplate tail tube cap [Providencia phage PSTRCR_121]UGO50223.1 putative baseplate tail tube cap [Morganella phage vB_MmoM_Rgz1]
MKAEELEESTYVKSGTSVSAGKSDKQQAVKTLMAQFPAERASGSDTSQDLRVHDLYKNGLLFTAFNYSARDTGSMRDFRKKQNTAHEITVNKSGQATTKLNREAIANILMPRSQSDIDNISHKFNEVGDSLATRGGGTTMGALSNMASTAVFGALESITQGAMADHGEQIYTTARSMYAGADNRTKIFTWHLTPRTPQDLIQILYIYEIFAYFSYGETGKSNFAKEIKSAIDTWYKETLINPLTPDGADTSNTIFENITSFLTNVLVVSNPTVWTIKNFGKTSSFDGRTDVFGPAQISNIRFDKSPNGHFNGLAIAPNLPSTFVLEVTFREILTLSRGTLFAQGLM